MDIVTDTSVLIAVVLNEPEKRAIINATAGHDLMGPASIRWEIGNALSAMLRRGRLSLPEATDAMSIFDGIPMRALQVDFGQALRLASERDIYAYDAYFLDCALRHKSPLLTLDERLRRHAQALGLEAPEIRA